MLVTKKHSKPKATATKKPMNPAVILKQHDPYIKSEQPHSSQLVTSPPDGLPPTQLRPHPQQQMDQRCSLSRNDAAVREALTTSLTLENHPLLLPFIGKEETVMSVALP